MTYSKMMTTPSKTIASLPDLCLLMVFDSFSLMEFVSSVSLTCRRWYSLRHSILARLPHRSEVCLKLGQAKDYNPTDDPLGNQLVWPVLTPARVNLLCSMYDSIPITELTLELLGASAGLFAVNKRDLKKTVVNFSALVHRWSDRRFRTIAFHVPSAGLLGLEPSELTTTTGPLVREIGSMRSLRMLKLDFYLLKANLEQMPFPVLSLLTCFGTCITDSADLAPFCRWVVANYGGNGRLKIVFPLHMQIYPSTLELEQVYQSGTPLGQFTGSFPEPEEMNVDQMRQFVQHFPGLTEFSIQRGLLNLSEMSQCLSLLPSLEHFQVSYPFNDYDDFEGNHPDALPYEALPSIHRLSLILKDDTITDAKMWFDWWITRPFSTVFPSLRVLCIEYFLDYQPDYPINVEPVLRYAQPFLECVDLERIHLGNGIQEHSFQPEQLNAIDFKIEGEEEEEIEESVSFGTEA